MSKTEDYLDSLLNGVSPEKKAEAERKKQGSFRTNFIDDFENELNDADMEDFIREFEIEVDEDDASGNSVGEDHFFDSLEGIVKSAKEKSEEKIEESSEEVFEVNTLEDDTWTDTMAPMDQEQNLDNDIPLGILPEDSMTSEGEDVRDEQEDFLDLLGDFQPEEKLSDLGELIRSDNEYTEINEEIQEDSLFGHDLLEPETSEEPKEKKSFFKKLMEIIFGKDEDEDEIEAPEKPAKKEVSEKPADNQALANLSPENLQILQELDAAGNIDAEQSAKKEEKPQKTKEEIKKEKKEKKEKVKQEKKEERERKKKEKLEKKANKPEKSKKPKEVDLSPPLPKKPVILIMVMGISVIALVVLMADMVGYSTSISSAKEAFAMKNYVEAYNNVAGLTVKENDVKFCDRLLLLAKVQGKLNTGKALYETKQYRMSLDAYICALGRYDSNYEDAVSYDIKKEYDALADEIIKELSEKYGVSSETAREIYGLRERSEYTQRIYEIIETLGLTEE